MALTKPGVVALVFSLGACASVGGTRDAPLDQGVYRIWENDVETVRRAAYDALVGVGARIDETTEVEPGVWLLMGVHDGGDMSGGYAMRVVVSPEEDGRSRVTLLARKRSPIAGTDHSEEFFNQIAFQLGDPWP